MARHLYKAISLHALGVQVAVCSLFVQFRGQNCLARDVCRLEDIVCRPLSHGCAVQVLGCKGYFGGLATKTVDVDHKSFWGYLLHTGSG